MMGTQSQDAGKKTVRAVIGTAGHVDHGKTTLVKTITGIDTDRLRQEKDRGISIELGFAFLDVPAGRLGIVDVPGHERFVRQMIAGAAGIDLVLLIVAADEGVMPQTLEHLDICSLLGVKRGGIVLTKTDLVDDEWLELVEDDVRSQVAGTFLADAPVMRFSAVEESATPRLRDWLSELVSAEDLSDRSADRPFKLSVDRVFTMRGFGTVVTGTSAAGTLKIGDTVIVQPQGEEVRVRGIQVHGEGVDSIQPGTRAAINLQGVDHDTVHRGDVLASRGGLPRTLSFDGTLTALRRLTKPIKDRAKVLVHIGTAQIQGKVILIGREHLEPGATGAVQVRLEHPTAILPGEPYVIRGFEVLESYGKTLGGGQALSPSLRPLRRRSRDGAQLVETLHTSDPEGMVAGYATFAGGEGLVASGLDARLPATRTQIGAAIHALRAKGDLIGNPKRLYPRAHISALRDEALMHLDAFHSGFPARRGMGLEELRSRLGAKLPAEVFNQLLTALGEDVVRTDDLIARQGFEARRSPAQAARCEQILNALELAGLLPPRVQDLPEMLDLSEEEVTEGLELLFDERQAIRVSRELAYGGRALEALQAALMAHLEREGTIDTAGLKALTGASRKWTIPLGEYFDRIKLTIRVGDARRLR